MGAGRKTQTIIVGDKTVPPWQTNSITARNLNTSDLDAVIFGCTHRTMNECFSNKLFGLPFHHIAYVKKIIPGMMLFLFNYSDRKLHGIFEAASNGQLNINSHAWTDDGSGTTHYPAQVKFRIRTLFQPLDEDQYGPVIASNYYESKLFWFELDKDQTSKLVSLFSSSQVIQNPRMLYGGSLSPNVRNKHIEEGEISDNQGRKRVEDIASVKLSSGLSYSLALQNSSSSVRTDQSQDSSAFPNLNGERQQLKARENEDVEENHKHEAVCEYPSSSTSYWSPTDGGMGASSPSQKSWCSLFDQEISSDVHARREDEHLYSPTSEAKFSVMDQYCLEWKPSPDVNREIDVLEDSAGKEELNSESLPVALANMVVEDDQGEDANIHSRAAMSPGIEAANFNSVVAKLLREVEELKESWKMQNQRIEYMEHGLAESRTEVQQLKDRCRALEAGCNFDELVLIAGGSDGNTFLTSLDLYSPFQDLKKPLSTMSSARPCSSAVNLNGELYIIGGGHQQLWYDTVESYNPTSNRWSTRPSLNQRKGNVAGVSLHDKLFAIGGGNAHGCLSEVEMLDVNAGKWIHVPSMLEKRFAVAASEINGVLYVVGGYNGRNYLSSVERFDPREYSWTRLGSMNVRRGCHSLTVLHEKLYALGGFNGETMVSTVEAFDPRVGLWTMEGSMNESRGYFDSFVIRDSIYVMGGMKKHGEALNMVECYKKGRDWKVSELKGIGKRCFFSAAVF